MSSSRILFMGTPEYAVPYLEGLIQAGLSPVAVFTQPDRPVGRGHAVQATPVKLLAEKYSIPAYQPVKIRDEQWTEKIRELAPDCIIVVAFGQIIPQAILDIPPKKCINVHPSLLPRHRGAAPLQETILSGDEDSAVSIMLMDAQMDHGPILRQEKINVNDRETYESLCEKTTQIGVPLLIVTLNEWLEGKSAPQEQDHVKATFTRLFTRDMGHIVFDSLNAQTIDRMVRALNPWPGTWCVWDNKRLKIQRAHVFSLENSDHKDTFEARFINGELLLLAHCNPGILVLEEVQLEGKNRISGKEFINGNLR